MSGLDDEMLEAASGAFEETVNDEEWEIVDRPPIPPTKQSCFLSLRVSEALHLALVEEAREHNRSVSDIIRTAIEEHLGARRGKGFDTGIMMELMLQMKALNITLKAPAPKSKLVPRTLFTGKQSQPSVDKPWLISDGEGFHVEESRFSSSTMQSREVAKVS